MNKATRTLIAIAALALSGGAFAQNNTLATPSVKSPVSATTESSGYGTPAAANTESGMSAASQGTSQQNATAVTGAYGANNTLARPSVKSPAAQ
ncbi:MULTISPECIES: hypothetical protein [unclassified Paraburkholderia]|uniref:hypothetical protein n=1 Tax=unclassified Paraburkholderia TaxID=2615204 RepID=UPI002AB03E28|nr:MULTISPECIES: hypothetical protein [unclassified Paraburkholderia]